MSADVVLWSNMSRAESPFHAIAAQALDDPSPSENDANSVRGVAPATSPKGAVEAETLKTSSHAQENGVHEVEPNNGEREEDNAGEETSGAGGPRQAKGSSAATPEGGNEGTGDVVTKKSKKRTNVWTKTTSRKSAKKNGSKNGAARPADAKDDNVILKPFHQEDDTAYPTLLSKIHKAEKIELSLDRLTASGQKGYRMVRATRGVVQGAWYFEIYIANLGSTGHTRLGWSSRRGDIQAPVGYDAHSYAYRDVDGSKVHCAIREAYGELYGEGDTIGFYINMPRDANYVTKPEAELVGWKGQPYYVVADEPLKPVEGSEILYFKNGVCQGVAFRDINDGTYYPAASMYTLPNQDVARVTFNFGPEFKYPPVDLGDRPLPLPVSNVSGPPSEASKAVGLSKAPPTDSYREPFETPGIKQRMVPDHTSVVGAEEQQQPPLVSKKEKVNKRVVKPTPPVPKKKEKPSKSLVTSSKNGLAMKSPGMAAKPSGVAPKTSGVTPKIPGIGLKNPGGAPKTPGGALKIPAGAPKIPAAAPKTPGVALSSKKSKITNGLPANPDFKSEAGRNKASKVDSVGGVLNLTGHGRRPWTLEKRIEGAQTVDVEVVIESSTGM